MEIGLMGTGLMGLPMAQRLLDASVPLIVYNRTVSKLKPLEEAGIAIAPLPEVLLRAASCVILMLTDAQAIREVLFSEKCRPELAGKTVIQMGTIAPAESRSLQEEIRALGGNYFEAPVLGSIPEALAGQLLVMVGSTPEQFDQWQDLLQNFGAHPIRVGEVGSAAALKLALNQLISSLTSAFGTSLEFVIRQGVEVETFMQILRGSALYAPTFDKKLQRMVEGNYANPNFPTKHLLKDTNLFIQAANAIDLDTSIPSAAQQILTRVIAQGLADADYSALFAALHQAAPDSRPASD
ncbi:MAG TPA: NAD(P)-dependent oxidoreductase [Microcoleaceae cyanobacterium]|jgi:3-hydroxyisobutyrate dehydrogenase